MSKLKVFLTVFGICLSVLFLIPVLFFSINFWGADISTIPQDWGTFGDYFGGLLNPLIAIANLIIFIKLTIIVTDMQDKSTKQSLQFEKKVLISGLMHESIKDLSFILNSLGQNIIENKAQTEWEILKVMQNITTFTNNSSHLFSDIESNELQNELNTLLTLVKTKPFNQQSFATTLGVYLNRKDQYLQKLHNQTISILEK